MKVILNKDIEFVGLENELVEVKNGFARNYLIPRKLASEATKSNMAVLKSRLKIQEKKQAEMISKLNSILEILKSNTIEIKVKTGTSGKIFGRITALHVSKAIKDALGYEIDRKIIELPEISLVGEYICKISFNKGANIGEVKINLVA